MPLYHVTNDGPKICRAQAGNCPLGGAHYQSQREAVRDYEARMEGNLLPPPPRIAHRPSQFAGVNVEEMQERARERYRHLSKASGRKKRFRYLRRTGFAIAASALLVSCGNTVKTAVDNNANYANSPNPPSLSHVFNALQQGVQNELPTLRGDASALMAGAKHDYHTTGAQHEVTKAKDRVDRYLHSDGPDETGQTVGRDGKKLIDEGRIATEPVKKFVQNVKQGYNN